MSSQLLRPLSLLRHPEASLVDEVFPAAQREAIVASVLAGPRVPASKVRRSRVPRRRVVLPASLGVVGAALAVVLLFALRMAPAVHAAGVRFSYPKEGPDRGYIVARVTDPFAAQASLDTAFRQAGLDIQVSLVPVSPSLVGTVVEISGPGTGPQIDSLVGGTCVTGGGGPGRCPIGVKIPRDFTGSGYITLGRPAKPGETYESTTSAFGPGEILHCSGLIGKTVAAARRALGQLGLTVQDRPASTDYVLDAESARAGVVWLDTQPTPLSPALLARQARLYDAGCGR